MLSLQIELVYSPAKSSEFADKMHWIFSQNAVEVRTPIARNPKNQRVSSAGPSSDGSSVSVFLPAPAKFAQKSTRPQGKTGKA